MSAPRSRAPARGDDRIAETLEIQTRCIAELQRAVHQLRAAQAKAQPVPSDSAIYLRSQPLRRKS